DDLGAVLGDYNPDAGAWIRFNPMDGKGCKNENVTEFRYALVESDVMELDKQNAILRQLEIPIACLVHSGNKSLHAIVKVDAANYDEYRKRVDYLYKVCQKNGLRIDSQNRNPSRLSRMPGVARGENKQFIVDTNIGKATWNEWFEWIEGVNDDLPDPESLTDFWDNMPKLAPPLIHGVLRQGHKMLMAGPSKAGKSYALIQLSAAIAEGKKWFGWQCEQGRVLYVNLELDRASCLHRFREVYQTLGYGVANISNIDIWNLRGKSVPMDKLAPKLIRRAHKKNYVAIIIDPIYKVITGDENSADQMAHFCNQFDRVCTDLEAAVIYCHHHSKGYQGGKKSMDRASGSGVFARDPDALIDLVELDLTDDLLGHELNQAEARAITDVIRKYNRQHYDEEVSQDDLCSAPQMRIHAKTALNGPQAREMQSAVETSRAA
ncbi:DNA primase, partial [bacterium]